jgi:SAM-dependent methyltransferase
VSLATISPITFKRDNYQRSRLFHPDSFKHSGKANLNLISFLLEPLDAGDLVVDVMGGTGSILVATDYQHPVITGELEGHWAAVSELNRKSITLKRLISATTPARCTQWDATRLPLASNSIPAIITSPPYWDMLSDWHIKSKGIQSRQTHEVYGPAYGVDPANIGNVHIYEDYLRAMALVYRECWRVLRPGAVLDLIIKNRVHKKRVVPIARDTIGLCTALGFRLVDRVERKTIPSLHRRVNQLHHPDSPTVDTEKVLCFEKQEHAWPVTKIALVQAPKPDSGPSWQLFIKGLAYARGNNVFILDHEGVKSAAEFEDMDQLQTPQLAAFRRRKELAFKTAHDLVTKHGFAAGDQVELHCSMKYGQYLAQRLTMFGGVVSNPTKGLNLGQKLRFYTNEL